MALPPGFLKFDGFKWVIDENFADGAPAGGDLTGFYPNPVVVQSSNDLFTVLGSEILFSGGTDLPSTDSLRASLLTVDAVANQVLNSITPDNGQMIRVISEVSAVRTDLVGEAAWFLLKGVWYRQGGSLLEIKAPEVIDSGFIGDASSWVAQLASAGSAVETQVTGEFAKSIRWSLIREWIRGS